MNINTIKDRIINKLKISSHNQLIEQMDFILVEVVPVEKLLLVLVGFY